VIQEKGTAKERETHSTRGGGKREGAWKRKNSLGRQKEVVLLASLPSIADQSNNRGKCLPKKGEKAGRGEEGRQKKGGPRLWRKAGGKTKRKFATKSLREESKKKKTGRKHVKSGIVSTSLETIGFGESTGQEGESPKKKGGGGVVKGGGGPRKTTERIRGGRPHY